MPELETILDRADRAVERLPMRFDALDRLSERRRVRRRNARVGAAVVAITLVALIVGVADRIATRSAEIPRNGTPTSPPALFEGLGGWMTYASDGDVFALDPNAPRASDPRLLVRVVGSSVVPLSWSVDGTRLLVSEREYDVKGTVAKLAILDQGGTLTVVPGANGSVWGAFAPDGTIVFEAPSGGGGRIVRIDPSTGTSVPVGDRSGPGAIWTPAVAIDGTVAASVRHVHDPSISIEVITGDPRTIVSRSELPPAVDVTGSRGRPTGPVSRSACTRSTGRCPSTS
jgi:hypothetical protein